MQETAKRANEIVLSSKTIEEARRRVEDFYLTIQTVANRKIDEATGYTESLGRA
jgi:hypothetical protein